MSTKKSRKKYYHPKYFYVSVLPLFSTVWETFTEKLTQTDVEKLIQHLANTGEYLAVHVYDYRTDTLLVTYKFVTREQKEEIEKPKRKKKVKPRVKPKLKPKAKPKAKPKLKPKRKLKAKVKKKRPRIVPKHKKYSTFVEIDFLSAYEKFKYICDKINQGLLVRFVFKVKQASPKTAMLIKQKKIKKQKEYYVTSEWNRFSSCESMNKYLNLRSRSYEEISAIYYMIRR